MNGTLPFSTAAFATFVPLLVVAMVATAHADTGDKQGERYGGISPHTPQQDSDGDAVDTSGVNAIEWIGFHPEDERTRIFVQTTRPVRYNVDHDASAQQVVLTIEGAQITRSNFRRFIDARHFERDVERIETRELDGQTIEVTVTLQGDDRPTVTDDGRFLFMDFPYDGDSATSVEKPQDEEQEFAAASVEQDSEPQETAPAEPPPVVEPDDDRHEERAVEDAPDDEDEPEPVADITPPETDDDTSQRRGWALPLAIGGLALAGGGVGTHLYAESQRETITSVPLDEVVPMTHQEAVDLESRTNTLDTAALGMVIAGGLATAVGVGAWLKPRSNESDSELTVSPTRDRVVVEWTFRY